MPEFPPPTDSFHPSVNKQLCRLYERATETNSLCTLANNESRIDWCTLQAINITLHAPPAVNHPPISQTPLNTQLQC